MGCDNGGAVVGDGRAVMELDRLAGGMVVDRGGKSGRGSGGWGRNGRREGKGMASQMGMFTKVCEYKPLMNFFNFIFVIKK